MSSDSNSSSTEDDHNPPPGPGQVRQTAPGRNSVLKTVKDTAARFIPQRDATVRELTSGDEAAIQRVTRTLVSREESGQLLRIKPAKDLNGIRQGNELFSALAGMRRVRWLGLKNKSRRTSFEIWFEEGNVVFYMYVPNTWTRKRIVSELDAQYPGASVETAWDASDVKDHIESVSQSQSQGGSHSTPAIPNDLLPIPPLPAGDTKYTATEEFKLSQDRSHPIQAWTESEDRVEADSFSTVEQIIDAYSSLLSAMEETDTTFTIQVVFSPARERWADRPGWGFWPWRDSADSVMEEYDAPTGDEKLEASRIQSRSDNSGFRVSLRVIGIGSDSARLARGMGSIRGRLEERWAGPKQRFKPRSPTGGAVMRVFTDGIVRELRKHAIPPRAEIYLSHAELGGLAHLPSIEEVSESLIAWETTPVGNEIPADSPQFGDYSISDAVFPSNAKPHRIPCDRNRFAHSSRSHSGSGNRGATLGDLPGVYERTDIDTSITGGSWRGDGRGDAPSDPGVEDEQDETATAPISAPGWLRESGLVSSDEELQYSENQSRWVSTLRYAIAAVGVAISLPSVLWSVAALAGLVEPGIAPQTIEIPAQLGLGVIGVVGGVGVWFAERFRRARRWYILTDEGLLVKYGIVNRRRSKYEWEKLEHIEKGQNILEERLGTGNVSISTAGTGTPEENLTWVRDIDTFVQEANRRVQTSQHSTNNSSREGRDS